MIYEYNKENVEELIQALDDDDIVQVRANDFLSLVGAVGTGASGVATLSAGASGKAKGRKPIALDEAKFHEVVARWQSGAITARFAMSELGLKPNTFYRRVKEYTEMTDIKELKKQIKEDAKELKHQVKAEAKEIKAEAKELKHQAKAEAKEIKAEAKELKKQIKEDAKEIENTIDMLKMEKEIRWEKLEAEAERDKEICALEMEVAAEAEEFKNM